MIPILWVFVSFVSGNDSWVGEEWEKVSKSGRKKISRQLFWLTVS